MPEQIYSFGRSKITIESDIHEALQVLAGDVVLIVREDTMNTDALCETIYQEVVVGYDIQIHLSNGIELIFGDIQEKNKKLINKIFRKIIVLNKDANTD